MRKLKRERNISIVMALHDINVALQLEKVMLIKGGEILGIGAPAEVLTEERIRQAFGVEVRIIRQQGENAYVSYKNNV